MMNKILQDLINTGKVVSFIDNVIVGTETEERHNKIVEEVVRKLAENNLYIKLEKYKWKVREVEFLEVVIRLKRINIRLVNSKRSQGYTEVFRTGKLLLLVY